jgi:hypothetical protein
MWKSLKGQAEVLAAYAGRKLISKRYVFRHTLAPSPAPDPNVRILTFERSRDIPEGLLDEIFALGLKDYGACMEKLFRERAVFHVLVCKDGRIGSLMWSKTGNNIKRWLVPVERNDVVMFSGFTPAAMRGRRYQPRIIQYVIDSGRSSHGRFFADCHVFNGPSRKSLLKNGFEIIGTARPAEVAGQAILNKLMLRRH